jgi:hypothetical protein
MIYCVWYPSGGFGHFISAILTFYGEGFVRPKNQLQFSDNGNSHNLDLITPKYFKDCWPGGIEFLNDKNYCVLVDNGINNQSEQFKYTFPNLKAIKKLRYDFAILDENNNPLALVEFQGDQHFHPVPRWGGLHR